MLERAIFLRRGAWLLSTHIDDQQLALERISHASGALDKLVPDEFADAGGQLEYEKVIAQIAWAEALARSGDPPGARQKYAKALALAQEIRGRFDDDEDEDEDEDALEYDQLIEYLREQMEKLEAVEE